jgi:hypothetical protein
VLTPRTDARNKSPGPLRPWSARAGDIVLVGAVVNLTYAAVVISALAHPGSRLSAWIEAWVHLSRKALTPVYVLARGPDCGGAGRDAFVDKAWALDVHLVTINLVVAAALFAGSRPFWAAWAERLYGDPSWRNSAPERRADAEAGFGTVLWGVIGTIWWLLLENDLFGSAGHCANLQPWFLFREPLLVTAAHGFACLAAALWAARRP